MTEQQTTVIVVSTPARAGTHVLGKTKHTGLHTAACGCTVGVKYSVPMAGQAQHQRTTLCDTSILKGEPRLTMRDELAMRGAMRLELLLLCMLTVAGIHLQCSLCVLLRGPQHPVPRALLLTDGVR